MFQQRHFEAIAFMMQETHPNPRRKTHPDATHPDAFLSEAQMQWDYIRDAMCVLFKRSNPRFNDDRFRRACEPGAYVRARTVA